MHSELRLYVCKVMNIFDFETIKVYEHLMNSLFELFKMPIN